MESRITKLESSLNSLKNALKQVEDKENELQSGIEKATDEINQWKMEVQGKFKFFLGFTNSNSPDAIYNGLVYLLILVFVIGAFCFFKNKVRAGFILQSQFLGL